MKVFIIVFIALTLAMLGLAAASYCDNWQFENHPVKIGLEQPDPDDDVPPPADVQSKEEIA